MQGSGCIDRQVNSNNRGIAFNNGAGINVTGTGVHVFQWWACGTPGILDTLQNEGAAVFAGDGTGALVRFHMDGNDTLGASARVGRCYTYRYVTTANTSAPYRTLTGTPSGNPQYFGSSVKTTGAAKGANLGTDACRYGTGAYITAGELADPATFAGFATQNDSINNRWGILLSLGGGNYELQGTFAIGRNNSGTPTAAYFVDSNKTISLLDTPHTLTDFTKFIVDHASTVFKWTGITIKALGTNNPGQLQFTDVAYTTDPELNSCTFENFGVTVLQAEVVVDGGAWRATDTITPNGATITGTTVANCADASGTLVINSPAEMAALSEMIFNDNNRAIEITAAGTYAFDGHLFSTNTKEVNFSGTGTCTINPSNGCNVVQGNCEATGGGTIVVNAVQNTFKFTLSPSITGYEWRVYTVTAVGSMAGASEIDGEETASADNQTVSHTYTSQAIAVQIIDDGYIESISYFTLTAANLDVPISLITEDNL